MKVTAQELEHDGCFDKITLFDLFPELKKSEDERIRKELIQYFKKFTLNTFAGLDPKKILSWLETKGEQKHTPKHKVGDTIYYNSFGDVKSMIVANVTTDSTDNPMYEDENGNVVFEEDLIEYNTTWSEEDDEMIDGLSNCLDELEEKNEWRYVYVNNKDVELNKLRKWLKSLKDRVGCEANCTTTKEWGEEDLYMQKQAIKCVNNSGKLEVSTEEIEDWLKSLRPQNRWKPSDEQMDVLLSEVIAWTKGCPKQKVLESLYNDLLKLKG